MFTVTTRKQYTAMWCRMFNSRANSTAEAFGCITLL